MYLKQIDTEIDDSEALAMAKAGLNTLGAEGLNDVADLTLEGLITAVYLWLQEDKNTC